MIQDELSQFSIEYSNDSKMPSFSFLVWIHMCVIANTGCGPEPILAKCFWPTGVEDGMYHKF